MNTAGGFECTCRPGYITDTDNKTCISKSDIGLKVRGGGLPYKNGGGARRTFKESKFVEWYCLGC